MTDLSFPPLPGDGEPALPRHEPFAWPTPPLPGYPAPSRATQPEACEVEGLNGKGMVGRLMYFHPADGLLKLRVAASRMTMTLRFDQFRRLRLLQPLAPLGSGEADTVADGGDARPAEPFALLFKDGTTVEGLTIGRHETEQGLYVFEPLDLAGSVRRSFFPRASYHRASLGGSAWAETDAAVLDEAPLADDAPAGAPAVCQTLGVRPVASIEDLAQAIDDQARMPMVRIGEALIALGFITPRELDLALEQQKKERGVALGQLLVREGVVTQADLQTALARKMRYPLVDAANFPVDPRALQRLPFAIAQRLSALPLMLHGGRLVVALEDPSLRLTIDEIEFASQCKAVPVLARAGTLAAALHAAYEKVGATNELAPRRLADGTTTIEFEPEDTGKLLASLEQTPEAKGGEDDGPGIEQSDNSLVRLINTMILEAQAQGVSDIHVETQPGREKVRIRFRKDGQLRPYLELPHTYRNALLARLKIMCDLDISERRKPQDGKINFARFVPGQRLELRVATIPTYGGLEDAVLRLLASAKPLPLDKLGLSAHNFERFKAVVARPYGMVLCVGPTGSGKTTTLHSALGYINTPDRKIWTAEDPIEITQAGLRQVQVNPRIDWTFAKALRAFLRADPDVIMVGEIRDQETSQVAIEASLTGHLVLSTLHTNSAPETVTRLLDMGMDPFNFADALLAVLAQRLVRRLCPDCRQPHEATEAELRELLADYRHAMGDAEGVPGDDEVLADWRRRHAGADGRFKIYRPAGCPKCGGSGYRGRAAIHELMTVSRAMRQLIQTGARAEELQRRGLAEGMRTLRQDGIDKVLAGLTTLDEVRAVSN
ncbi:GspE/PulE family protein [Rubrivivax gelatinosus]|uniref:Type II secretory ATPase GspE/PulE/Tfp pilus assembly ATPase PilB-like protein n=1 Tax=Rubrivivax gelatinosus TaxID=28068 RepID=A0A4R2MH83_RUBGE|nr:ATPase, T2SS/T4P/T4SS family [Rubrivivax gelatinosus]TCO98392.1 type II secretory ATPase GspE/PulE/Tfp pilus assembly ATPase PilB-like protein [Rubrivivax gelatinosus]